MVKPYTREEIAQLLTAKGFTGHLESGFLLEGFMPTSPLPKADALEVFKQVESRGGWRFLLIEDADWPSLRWLMFIPNSDDNPKEGD